MRIGSLHTCRQVRIAACVAAMAALALPRCVAQTPARGRTVAITLDDGPVVNEMKDLENFRRIAGRLREALVAEKVPATIFINERQLNVPGQRDGRAEVLAQWLEAGYDLANHTYSHPSINKVPLWQFEDDLVRGEVVMRSLLEARGRKLEWFRYPFLDSGPSAEVHQAFLDFLEQRHYRVAHVTVDYKDYSFAGVYARQLRAGKSDVAEKIKQAYLDQVPLGFEHSEKASMELYGYELPQILLIHCNELNSVSLRESIARMRQRGYSFVTLDEATRDPAYLRPDTFAGNGGSWLERTARTMGKKITDPSPRMPTWIAELSGPAR
jgi:peptidoglycan/xylan/chitin deacetylase (PgdA/CDA1 family)